VNLIIFLNKCGLLLGNHEWFLKQIQIFYFASNRAGEFYVTRKNL